MVKRTVSLFVLMAMTLSLLLLTGCGTQSSIYGVWKSDETGEIFTFREDGTGVERDGYGEEYDFTYRVREDLLILERDGFQQNTLKLTYKLKGSKLTLTRDYEDIAYKKVADAVPVGEVEYMEAWSVFQKNGYYWLRFRLSDGSENTVRADATIDILLTDWDDAVYYDTIQIDASDYTSSVVIDGSTYCAAEVQIPYYGEANYAYFFVQGEDFSFDGEYEIYSLDW